MIEGISAQVPIVPNAQPAGAAGEENGDATAFLQLLTALGGELGGAAALTQCKLGIAGQPSLGNAVVGNPVIALSDLLRQGDNTSQDTALEGGPESQQLTEAAAEIIIALLGQAAGLLTQPGTSPETANANAGDVTGTNLGTAGVGSLPEAIQEMLTAAVQQVASVGGSPETKTLSKKLPGDVEAKLPVGAGAELLGQTSVTTAQSSVVWPQGQDATQLVSMAAALGKALSQQSQGQDRDGPSGHGPATATGSISIAKLAAKMRDQLPAGTIVVEHAAKQSTDGSGSAVSSVSAVIDTSDQGMASLGRDASNAGAAGVAPLVPQTGQSTGNQAAQPNEAGQGASFLSTSVVEQIARRAHLLVSRGRSSGLSIQLEPRDLGKVQIYVSDAASGMHVQLAAEAQNTTEMLNAALPQLKAALESQGVRVESCQVSVGLGFSTFGSPQDGGARPQNPAGIEALRYVAKDDEGEPHGTSSIETRAQSTLIDYRI